MIAMALYRRAQTGEGCAIEIPMFENLVKFVLEEHMYLKTFEPPLGETGDPRLLDPLGKPIRRGRLDLHFGEYQRTGVRVLRRDRPAGAEDRSAVLERAGAFRERRRVLQLRAARSRRRRPRSGSRFSTAHDVPAMPITRSTACWRIRTSRKTGSSSKGSPDRRQDPQHAAARTSGRAARAREWNPAPKLGQNSVEILREAGYGADEVERMSRTASPSTAG